MTTTTAACAAPDCRRHGQFHTGPCDFTKVYRDADLVVLMEVITDAASIWAMKCAEFVKSGKNSGTCVLGAGIEVDYLPARAKNYRPLRIIGTPWTADQGSLSWETSLPEVLGYLKQHGVDARYNPGRMD
jgi:hypothetical protein